MADLLTDVIASIENPTPYQVAVRFGKVVVERELPCINGLSAWFVIAEVPPPDSIEYGYTEGAIGMAQDRARQIVEALNGLEPAQAKIAEQERALRRADEHAQRIAAEAQRGFDALQEIDEAWDVIGTVGNRKILTLPEQIAVLNRELEAKANG